MCSKKWARASSHRALLILVRGLDFIGRVIRSNYKAF